MPSNPINAPAGDFLTRASSGVHLKTYLEAITQLPSGELRAGAVKARRPRAATRVGGAERRALHGAEHSSKLERVMAANYADAGQPFADEPDDGGVRFPEDMRNPQHSQMTCGRRGRKTMDTGQAPRQ